MSAPQLPRIETGKMMPVNYVPLDPHHSPQRMASTLDKMARYTNVDPRSKKTVGNPSAKGKTSKGKAKVTKTVGRAIVGRSYSPGKK